MRNRHYQKDAKAFPHEFYTVNERWARGVAFVVLGWETEPDEDTEWTGDEARTGFVLAVMVGDDYRHRVDARYLEPLERREFCGGCGQIGCHCDAYQD